MANGFLTESPGARHGANDAQLDAGYVACQKFTCPGSGAQDISEIGAWVEDSGFEFRLAIFTDDSGNACPEVMVANSESATLSSEASLAKISHTYGTKPQLTGGVDYWLCIFFDNLINIDYLSSSGENTLYVTGYTAYTWPTTTDWHTNTPAAIYDLGLYAVYESAVEDLSVDEFETVTLVEDITAKLSNLIINENEAITIQEDIIAEVIGGLALEQEGFRWRDDDNTEALATWLATQDVDTTRLREVNTRLRFLINATGDHDAKQFKLQYKKTSEGTWRDMPEN